MRKLNTNIPLDTLRLVINLATEIGREGREGKPVGTILVVGDVRRVQSMSTQLNFNPFKGYSKEERDLKDRKVRESVKEFAQLDGAILIDPDGVAVSACVSLNAEKPGDVHDQGIWNTTSRGRSDQPQDQCNCRLRESNDRGGPRFSQWRSGDAHRTAQSAARLAAAAARGARIRRRRRRRHCGMSGDNRQFVLPHRRLFVAQIQVDENVGNAEERQ